MAATGNGPYDIAIIGGGPGGYAAALYAGAAGLSVTLVEEDKVGGTCLHRGCVPAKELLETAAVYRSVGRAKEFGVEAGRPVLDMASAQARKRAVVAQLHKGLSGLLAQRKVVTIAGTGRLAAPGRVEVTRADGTNEVVDAGAVILAAGSSPRTLPGFVVDGRTVRTSDEVLELDAVPARAVVIGGGAVGCEFASMLADLGSQVVLLEVLPKLLPGCDDDVVTALARAFKKRGIDVRTGVNVIGHTAGDGGTVVHLEGAEDLAVDTVVVCVGRAPRSEGLADSVAGVAIDAKGHVEVDGRMRTSAEGVWAVGDLVATPQLAHVGFAEAMVAVRDILGEGPVPIDYGRVPWCIYSHPEVAFAGHTETSAKAAGIDVVVKKDPLGGNSRARILGETDGLVKVVAERASGGGAGRIVGVHMVGPWVTEQLGAGYLALNWDATAAETAAYIQPHPTLSEAFGETVLALTGRGLHVG